MNHTEKRSVESLELKGPGVVVMAIEDMAGAKVVYFWNRERAEEWMECLLNTALCGCAARSWVVTGVLASVGDWERCHGGRRGGGFRTSWAHPTRWQPSGHRAKWRGKPQGHSRVQRLAEGFSDDCRSGILRRGKTPLVDDLRWAL
jgi:hypothetical protein